MSPAETLRRIVDERRRQAGGYDMHAAVYEQRAVVETDAEQEGLLCAIADHYRGLAASLRSLALRLEMCLNASNKTRSDV